MRKQCQPPAQSHTIKFIPGGTGLNPKESGSSHFVTPLSLWLCPLIGDNAHEGNSTQPAISWESPVRQNAQMERLDGKNWFCCFPNIWGSG